MSDISSMRSPRRDRIADCQARAADDRLRAEGMDTRNGRRKFEESAASWDRRAELLGRLDASFNKRKRLDAEAGDFRSALRAKPLAGAAGLGVWEGEGGAIGSRPSRSAITDGAGAAAVRVGGQS